MQVFPRRSALLIGAAALLSACASKFKTYRGPEVTSVVVNKGARSVYLLHHTQILKAYPMQLGFAPNGHKTTEGDGRTPEGLYVIDRRNPNSEYHLSIGINYPNNADQMQAYDRGVRPGGDIFIHGTPRRYRSKRDWTAGCIAVSNDAMEDIYAMVRDGTPIRILP